MEVLSILYQFCMRLIPVHFFTFVLVGGISYLLIMRCFWPNIPATTGLREITSPHVQLWIWPAQFYAG